MNKNIGMKFKNLTKILCLALAVTFVFACSEKEETNDDNGSDNKVTEQLPMPGNVTYSATMTSIQFEWGSVSGATSYEVSLAPAASSSNAATAETTSTNYNFTGLEVNTSYVFMLRALYSGNSAFNSEWLEMTVMTENYTKLNTPTNLTCSAITTSGARITWNSVTSAANYRIIISEADGDKEVVNNVQTGNTYSASGLSESTMFNVSVQALIGDGSVESEYDSDLATATFETGPKALTAPTVSIAHKSHSLAIMEWDLPDAALSEQGLSSDTYNFRLCDADGNVLREKDGYNAFNFTKYPSFRIAWGGLTPSTTYKLEIQRVPTANPDFYFESDWASVEVTTDPAPDTSGYLLYWDFDNVPFNSCSMYKAYGFRRKTSEDDWANPDNVDISGDPSDLNTIYTQTLNKSLGQTFYDTYLYGITVSDIIDPSDSATYTEGSTHNVTVQVGHTKFGASSRPAWISLPACEGLSSDSTIYLEIDTCPYTEPNSSGDWYSPSNADITEWFYVWGPGAKIESVEGETAADAVVDSTDEGLVKLRNVLVTTMSSDPDADPYRFTSHKIKISGVDSSTRITIYTALVKDSSQHRMWMDNVKISLAD